MQPEPNNLTSAEQSLPGSAAPGSPASQPPEGALPPPVPDSAPPPTSAQVRKPSLTRQLLALLLSLGLGLFLADAFVSLLDDSLILFFNAHGLAAFRGTLFLLAILSSLLIYALMELTPMIPKRVFLPVTLFNPLAGLLLLPVMIYWHSRLEQAAWLLSLCQVTLGLVILWRLQGTLRLHWPLFREDHLAPRAFSWLNLSGFLLMNLFVLVPAVVAYCFLCASLAVGHFSEGFVALRASGLTVEARKYVRNDGKTIQLVPMAHIGQRDFYRELSQSFPSNSIILMEGVSDTKNLLTNKITYRRMANSLGLAEQQREFRPPPNEAVSADIDVDQFEPGTIDFLNLVMLIHSKGLTPENLIKLMQYSPPPNFEQQLWEDLLKKRNRNLLNQIDDHLDESANLIVPWGAAHMPGIADGIQKAGFRLVEQKQYQVIGFGARRAR